MATCVSESEECEVIEKMLCGACKRDDESSTALYWCKDCKDALCEECFTVHKRIRPTSKHQPVSLLDITEDIAAAMDIDININCPLHLEQPLIIYCKFHNELCCVVCACTSHNECKTLIPIDDVAVKCSDQQVLDNWSKEFLDIQDIIQRSAEEKEEILINLDNDRDTLSSEISHMFGKVHEKLQTLHSEFNASLQQKHNTVREAQENTMKTILDFNENVGHYATITKTLCHLSPKEALIKANTLRTKTTEQYTKLLETLQNAPNIRLKLSHDSKMSTILDDTSVIPKIEVESNSMTSLSNVKPIEDIIKPLHVGLELSTPVQNLVSSPIDLMTAGIRLVKSWSWTDLNMFTCPWFTDGKYIDDKFLLLADYTKSRLVLLYLELKMKREVTVNGKPSSLAVSDNKEDIYIVCNNDSILKYRFPELQRGTEIIEGLGDIWTIAVTSDHMITGHLEYIAIRDIQGQEQRRIEKTMDKNYISVYISDNVQQVCHGDCNTFVKRNMNGDEIWRYKNGSFSDSRGTCCDRYGNVYAVGRKSENVHQISLDGSAHRILGDKVSSKIIRPYAIIFHPTKNSFVVTSFEETVVLEMYEFDI